MSTPKLPGVPAETHTNQGPLDRNGVFELIRDQLADILDAVGTAIDTLGGAFTMHYTTLAATARA